MDPISIQSLAAIPTWVAWQTEDRGDGTRPTKVPYSPLNGKAKADVPSTWGIRADAEARAAKLPKPFGSGGIGIELSQLPASTLCTAGIDLDSCRNTDGNIEPWAAEIIARFSSYTEISPSGTGAKIFFAYEAADLPKLRTAVGGLRWGRQFKRRVATDHPPAIELYLGNRYFAVTEQRLKDAPDEFRLTPLTDLVWLIRVAGPNFAGEAEANPRQAGRDKSRSAIAFGIGKQMRKVGYTYDEMVAALRTDPRTADWATEKGNADNGREFLRIWQGAEGSTPKPPSGSVAGWLRLAQVNREGEARCNTSNVLLALREDARLRDLFAYDEMAQAAFLMHPVPSLTIDGNSTFKPRPVQDSDITALVEFLQLEGLFTVNPPTVFAAMELRAKERSFHPVRDYLNSIKWDGIPRVGTWLHTYLGAEDIDYTRAVGEMFLISMVARIFQPGCQVDYVPIIQGGQGVSKSSACKILAGEWFSDNLPDMHSKDAAQHLAGRWLIELPELASMARSEIESQKAFVTRREDKYRPSYGRLNITAPRQCAFIGTTNDETPLKDETGNRRQWPFRAGKIDLPALARDRDALFAEAVHLYRSGKPWWPDRQFEEEQIAPQQEARRQADAWEEIIAPFLVGKTQVLVSTIGLEALGIDVGKFSRSDQLRIRAVLFTLGWRQGTRTKYGRYYYPPDAPKN